MLKTSSATNLAKRTLLYRSIKLALITSKLTSTLRSLSKITSSYNEQELEIARKKKGRSERTKTANLVLAVMKHYVTYSADKVIRKLLLLYPQNSGTF
jgi:hypothetical protein